MSKTYFEVRRSVHQVVNWHQLPLHFFFYFNSAFAFRLNNQGGLFYFENLTMYSTNGNDLISFFSDFRESSFAVWPFSSVA